MDRFIQRIIEILSDNMQDARGIKQIYYGDVWAVPIASMPAIVVRPSRTVVQIADNRRDNDLYAVEIILVMNVKADINQNKNELSWERKAVQIFEERKNGTTNEIKADTILGCIRKIMDDDFDYVLKTDAENINYDIVRNREFPTYEPTLTLTGVSKIYNRE